MSLVILHRRRNQAPEYIPVFKTTSNSSNWCFNRFRLYTASANTMVQARKADGTIISTQLYSDPAYTWGADYEASFLFDFSFNTTNEEISIFITGIGTAAFQQCYAYTGHAGSAVRWYEDANITQGITNAQLKYVNLGFLKFNSTPDVCFVYMENQGIYEIDGADQFYGKLLDVRNNNIPALTADQIIKGCNNNGMGVGTLYLSGNNGRTAASDADWNSLVAKGWNLNI